MAAHLIRLKLTLLRHQLRGSIGQVLGLALSVLGGLSFAFVLVVVAVLVRLEMPVDEVGAWLTLIGAVAVLGWAAAPLANLGGDQTLDPERFVTFAIPRRQLVVGLLAGGAISVPALVTAVGALATVVVWSRDVVTAAVALVGAAIGLATCLVATRASGTGLALLQGGRRLRELLVSVGLLLVIGLSFTPFLLTQGVVELEIEALAPVAVVLGWTPLGWAWSAPWHAATGALGVAVVKLVLAAGLVPLLMRAWGVMLERRLVHPPSSGQARARGGRSILAAVPGATGAVAVRCLTYWRRDPRYSLSLVMLVVLPLLLLLLVPVGWMGLGTWALLLGPLIAYFVGWGLHNDIAYDADPWWLHLAVPVPGTADRAGRVLASAVWGVPAAVVASVVGAVIADRPEMLPALVGGSLAVMGAGYGVSSIAAVVVPYWAPAPGENPNATPPGAGGQMALAQVVTGSATLLVAGPVIVPFVLAWRGSTTASWIALVLGIVLSVAVTLVGIRIGGRVLDRRAPELLATVRR